MRLLTYNIHSCVGMDRKENPDRILQIIHEADADIVALQEVDRREGADRCVIENLENDGSYTVIYAPTFARVGSQYGNLLASRLPVTHHRSVDLSYRGREPRGAISAVIESGVERVALVATHLGLSMSERRSQVEQLVNLLASDPEARSADLHVLLGDFNEWFVPGRPLRRLRRHFGKSTARRTFPATFPLFKLDRIWVKPADRLRRLEAVRGPLAQVASDHLPLIAEIEVAPMA